MKRMSAFAVFASKSSAEKKGKPSASPALSIEDGVKIKRAESTPTMGKRKKLLKALRNSVRGSGHKSRPQTPKEKDSVSLTLASSMQGKQVLKPPVDYQRKPKIPVRQTSTLIQPKKVISHDAVVGSARKSMSPVIKKVSTAEERGNMSLPGLLKTTAEANSEKIVKAVKSPKVPTQNANGLSKSPKGDNLSLSGKRRKSPGGKSYCHVTDDVSISKKMRVTRDFESSLEIVGRPKSQKSSGLAQALEGGDAAKPKIKRRSSGSSYLDMEKVPNNEGDTRNFPTSKEQPACRPKRMPNVFDSNAEATRMFECLIHPVTPDRFFRELWEKKPLLVKRHTPDYNSAWFSTKELDRILRQENIHFGVNLDITSYRDDKRETHNPDGRAYAPVVWDFYQRGCSVRLLNPQTYSRNVWKILSVLQDYFNCSVGANVYLTPPGTQGFAPHYDDIEAFVIQLEGKKHWKLYNPRSDAETLPRFSSGNFSQNEMANPILNVVLEAGDLLYFPRGTIHQASASEDEHSLHITFSCYQRNTWGDLLEQLVPQAVQLAIEENVEFRRGLPRDYNRYMGIAHSEKDSADRKQFIKTVEELVKSIVKHLPVDAACDQLSKASLISALPPAISEQEKACSVHGAGEYWSTQEGQVRGVVELEPDTEIRLIRGNILRIVSEEDEVRIYHSLENSRTREDTPRYIVISSESAPAVECLIDAYPEYITIDSLPLASVTDKVEIATTLYDKGMLMTSHPLPTTYDEGDNDSEEEFEEDGIFS
ncbi:ribosomal oxygenase 1-like [Pomacea canaliculata]|uniref:ribosomal oxygenase 1-like n=1 Tax=Pomacea canaliculata TaxID=400727 RepID=UPI000D72B908|nr:ribosomal oxygenase 1-like [Pomacea canaliculata]